MEFREQFVYYVKGINSEPMSIDFTKNINDNYRFLVKFFCLRNEKLKDLEEWLKKELYSLLNITNYEIDESDNFEDLYLKSIVRFELISDYLNLNNCTEIDFINVLNQLYNNNKKSYQLLKIFSLVINYCKETKTLRNKLIRDYKSFGLGDQTILLELEVR
ncbi:conserved protein of unknown function [Tenacibaculum sp. 190524A02b]|uniref:hypothetical protein n=1 Tax=Tenacibaculum vairaonense TaxID=3137860 RepID=UPI0032B2E621